MAKGRLPPAPPRTPIPEAISEGYSPDTADIHGKLAVLEERFLDLDRIGAASEADPDAKTLQMLGPYDGEAWSFSTDDRAALRDGLAHCRAARAALATGDAVEAATAVHDVMLVLFHLLMSPVIAPAFQGFAYAARQRRFRLDQADEAATKHDQWRKWQRQMHAESPKTATLTKIRQAELLIKRHSIDDSVQTVRKQLEPLPRK